MKTIEMLCERFDRKFPAYISYPLRDSSYRGHYRILIIDYFNADNGKVFIFKTCREFQTWISHVELY